MTKRRQAQVATFAVLAGLVGLIAIRRGPKVEATPQDAVYAMLDAARAGDVSAYLSYYTDEMRGSLKQAVAESTEPGFSRYLRESNAGIKGVAINEPEKLSETEVKVRVEYVYQDRNEVQNIHLQRAGSGWRISRMDSTGRIQAPIPYGTPVGR